MSAVCAIVVEKAYGSQNRQRQPSRNGCQRHVCRDLAQYLYRCQVVLFERDSVRYYSVTPTDLPVHIAFNSASLAQHSLLSSNPQIPSNALLVLEKLTNMPSTPSDLKQWWVEGLGAEPSALRSLSGVVDLNGEIADEQISTDDWRAYFDDTPKDPKETKLGKRRLHTMTIHQQLHSLAAHRAVFTKCWLSLLPQLSSPARGCDGRFKEENVLLLTRALSVLHRGVMPHLTRAAMVMDWVTECVDFGENLFLMHRRR